MRSKHQNLRPNKLRKEPQLLSLLILHHMRMRLWLETSNLKFKVMRTLNLAMQIWIKKFIAALTFLLHTTFSVPYQ